MSWMRDLPNSGNLQSLKMQAACLGSQSMCAVSTADCRLLGDEEPEGLVADPSCPTWTWAKAWMSDEVLNLICHYAHTQTRFLFFLPAENSNLAKTLFLEEAVVLACNDPNALRWIGSSII